MNPETAPLRSQWHFPHKPPFHFHVALGEVPLQKEIKRLSHYLSENYFLNLRSLNGSSFTSTRQF